MSELHQLLKNTLKEYARKGFQKAEEFLKEMEELEAISTEIGYHPGVATPGHTYKVEVLEMPTDFRQLITEMKLFTGVSSYDALQFLLNADLPFVLASGLSEDFAKAYAEAATVAGATVVCKPDPEPEEDPDPLSYMYGE